MLSNHFCPQIKQEMELILSRPGVLNTFTSEWTRKWVPAIVEYSKALKRRDIVELISDQNSSGTVNSLFVVGVV